MTATLVSTDPVLASFAADVGPDSPVSVRGNGTRWDLGGPVDDNARIMSAPTGIVDYTPEEMIVTVRAGTSVADLHDALRERGQWTALPERGGTVGGAIAVGQNGHERPARGDLRAALLQVRYVSADGRIVTGGGPTVKNVSGFDLPRLLTGSLGTLGCIAEVLLRTNPIPGTVRWLTSDDADPFEVHRTLLTPGSVLWDGTTTTVMLLGHEVAVDADTVLLETIGSFTETADPGAPNGHRWSVPPSELVALDTTQTGAFVAEIGVGIVHAERQQVRPPLPAEVQVIHDRMKAEFDPTSRLNPGRVVGVR